jgi:hypothetical protein
MDTESIHILLRFSDKLGAIGDTIAAHKQVIAAHGSVWFGKMGRPLSRKYIERINAQCEAKIPTHLYLVQAGRGGYQVYRGNLLKMSRELPSKERKLIPTYYTQKSLLQYMRLWSKLSALAPFDNKNLSSLQVASSGSPIVQSLHGSMAGLFIVRERSNPPITYRFP